MRTNPFHGALSSEGPCELCAIDFGNPPLDVERCCGKPGHARARHPATSGMWKRWLECSHLMFTAKHIWVLCWPSSKLLADPLEWNFSAKQIQDFCVLMTSSPWSRIYWPGRLLLGLLVKFIAMHYCLSLNYLRFKTPHPTPPSM